MTPQEKATELISKYEKEILKGKYRINGFVIAELAKECALIAVGEILRAYPHTYDIEKEYTSEKDEIMVIKNTRQNNEFWYQVKQEIEKL